jgi:uncharacterized protein (TIGR03437 family)
MNTRIRRKWAARLLGGVALFHTAVSFGADAGKVSYTSYFGGIGTAVNAMASDTQGNVYLGGVTLSADLPVTAGAYHPQPYPDCSGGRCQHAFVAKVSASGGLVWSTYLGGNGSDAATGIAVDPGGNVYVAGATGSTDFPLTSDAVLASAAGAQGFLVKLDAAGAKLLYGSYLGGTASAVAWGGNGSLVVTGTTGRSASVMGWRSAGMTLVFSRLLGGSGTTAAHAAAIGADGGVYVAGSTNSSDFPLKNAIPGVVGTQYCPVHLVNPDGPCSGAFVTKLSADGSGVLYSTLLGGSQENSGTAVTVDAAGSAIVAGNTASADFPLVHAAMAYPGSLGCQTTATPFSATPCPHGFVSKLTPDGSQLVYSTYVGGKDAAVLAGAAVDSAGSVWVVGSTMGNGFPATPGAAQHANGSQQIYSAWVLGNQGMDGIELRGTAGILTKLQGDGTLEYASYFGGTGGGEQVLAAASAPNGGVWFAGPTGSTDLSVGPGAIQAANNGHFVARTDLTAGSGAPHIDTGGLLNSANLTHGAVAPGEIVTIFGSGLGPTPGVGAQLDVRGFVAKQLAGTSVTFDGMAAPLLYAGANQINAIVPFGVAGKTGTQIVVTVNGVGSPADVEAVAVVSPGIYSSDMSGTGQAAALNQDGTVNSASNPAARGSVVSFWITGAGLLNAAYADGEIVTNNPAGLALPLVSGAAVQYAGQAPGMVAGVVQLNLVVGADLPPWVTSGAPNFTIGGVGVYPVFVALR